MEVTLLQSWGANWAQDRAKVLEKPLQSLKEKSGSYWEVGARVSSLRLL